MEQNNEIRRRQAPGRRIIFAALLILLPLISGLAIAEGILRIVGFGYATSFFDIVKEDGVEWVVENPEFGKRFFPDAIARRPLPTRFPREKPLGTTRIFILGGSAAMGDPEPAFSPARMLEQLLESSEPGKQVEVINAAMTAVNSHVVEEVMEDCLRYEPDLVIVYLGNNEVIGPFGPRQGLLFRLPQWWQELVKKVASLRIAQAGMAIGELVSPPKYEEWSGMDMYLENSYEASDPVLERVYAAFRGNLEGMIEAASDHNVPVILNTVSSNVIDFPPFASAEIQIEDTGSSRALAKQLWELVLDGDYSEARSMIAGLPDEAMRVAEVRFLAAWLEEQDPDVSSQWLRENFQAARDLDVLRFRADSGLNFVLESVAGNNPGSCILVDSFALLKSDDSRSGQPGDQQFYEHVHFTFEGAFRLAEGWASVIERLIPDASFKNRVVVNKEKLQAVLGFTVYEQLAILQMLIERFNEAPFTAQPVNHSRIELFQARVERIQSILSRPGAREHLTGAYEQALLGDPNDYFLNRNFGLFLSHHGNDKRAEEHLLRCLDYRDSTSEVLYELGLIYLRQDKLEPAGEMFLKLENLSPGYPGLDYHQGVLAFKSGNWKEAEEYLRKSLENNPDHAQTKAWLDRVLKASN